MVDQGANGAATAPVADNEQDAPPIQVNNATQAQPPMSKNQQKKMMKREL